MKNKKIIAAIVVTSIALSGITYSYASEKIGSENIQKEFEKDGIKKYMKIKGGHMIKGLDFSDDEKESLKEMSKEERKTFLELKRNEMKLIRGQRENVIDKLLAGETLNNEEEIIRADIIEDRAERKLKREEREAKREEIKSIIEKKKSGEELSDDEEKLLSEMKNKKRGYGKRK